MWYQKSGFCIPFLIWLPFVLTFNEQDIPLLFQPASPTAPANMSANDADPLVYYVCGAYNPATAECRCYRKSVECYTYSWESNTFKTANIQIVTPNFTAESVGISDQNFGVLKKNETLPAIADQIKFLRLISNNITEIDDGTFDNFDSLELLSLSGNRITNLTSKVFTQKLGSTLLTLNLDGNILLKISSIDFTYMTNLKSLNLGGNYDAGETFAKSTWTFPKSLSNLTWLSLAYCNITHIPDNVFENLVSLASLNLYYNPLTTYPKILNSISTLRNLDLSSTHIKNLNQTMLGNNQNLSSLSFQFSQIFSIDDCAFCGFTNLTRVNFFHSMNFSFIHENAFGHAKNGITPKIESFAVEYCNLTVIPENLLPWQSVKEISIGGNPFNCSCEMAWLIKDILNPTFTMNLKNVAWFNGERSLQCRYPLMYKSIPFSKLNQKYCKKPKPSQKHPAIFGFGLFLIFAVFIAAVILLCRYLLRLKKQKTLSSGRINIINKNFESENFDSNP